VNNIIRVLVVAAPLAAGGCGSAGAGFSPTSPGESALVSQLDAIRISGTTSSAGANQSGPWRGMVPGETAQFRAIVTFADGTGRDVTSDSSWRVVNESGGNASYWGHTDAPGSFVAESPGWFRICVDYGRTVRPSAVHDEAVVRVAPEGTFLVKVMVDDGRWTVGRAIVEASSKAGVFRAMTDDYDGIVTLQAVGETVLQVQQSGCVTARKVMTVTSDLEVGISVGSLDAGVKSR
jgi:hypothetical protein